MRILFDCDDTLVDFMGVMCSDRSMARESIITRDIGATFGMTMGQWLTELIRSNTLERCQLFEETQEVLNKLVELGHQLEVITNRGFHPDALAVTQDNLVGLPISDFHIVPFHELKSEYMMMNTGWADIFVDDSATHCETVAASGMAGKVFLRNMPHNQQHVPSANVQRINTLRDILEHV